MLSTGLFNERTRTGCVRMLPVCVGLHELLYIDHWDSERISICAAGRCRVHNVACIQVPSCRGLSRAGVDLTQSWEQHHTLDDRKQLYPGPHRRALCKLCVWMEARPNGYLQKVFSYNPTKQLANHSPQSYSLPKKESKELWHHFDHALLQKYGSMP